MALAGVMCGADGVIIEAHENPEKAYSDGAQTLYHEQAEKLYHQLNQTHQLHTSF